MTCNQLLAGAVLCALGAGASAQSNVTLTGVVDAAVRHSTNSQGSLTSLASGSNSTSRFILRGVEDLGSGLKASFWLEGAFNADTGTSAVSNQFFDRRSTVGLAGPWGEVRLGRDWNPAFLSWAGTDPFVVVGVGGAINMWASAPSVALRRAFGAGATTLSRSNNALQYLLPANLGGVYGQLMVAPGEEGNAQGNYDYHGARLGYAAGPFDVGGFYGNTRIDATNAQFRQSGARASYHFGGAILSGSFTQSAYLGSKHKALLIGLSVPVGVGVIKASYVKVDQSGRDAAGASIAADDAQRFAVGYVHNLSKRTAVYVNAGHVSNKGRATFAISGGRAGNAPGTSSSGYEVGLRHHF